MATLNGDWGVNILCDNFNTRAAVQFGTLHPADGLDTFSNAMGFRLEKMTGTRAFVPPDVTFKDEAIEEHDIADGARQDT